MSWNSFDDFIHMGGYGLYVWGSYGVTLVVMVAETLLARRRRRQALQAVRETGAEVAA
jgi:heme exporter protein D